MRLLVVSQYFWPENFRVNDLAAELVARGHEVTVLTGQPNYPDGEIFPEFRDRPGDYCELAGAEIVRVPVIPRGRNKAQLVLNYLSFALSASVLGIFRLRRRRFDAIFVFQTSPITAALPAIALRRIKQAPVLMWVLDAWPDTLSAVGIIRSPRLLAAVGGLVRFTYRRCDRILVQSEAFFDNVRRYAGNTEHVRYFPNWPEPVFAQSVEAAAAGELGAYEGDFNILFAGNVGEAQDFPAILDAAAALSDVPRLRWLIVGDGRAAPMVREDIALRGLEDKVILLGRHPIERMPSFFAASDAMLVSLRNEPIWAMTIPGKIQSYFAAGKPVLAMLNGEGARVIGESGAGLVAPAGDGLALARQVLAMMAMPKKDLDAMGAAGRNYCRAHFDRSKLFNLLESWLDEVSLPRTERS